MAMGIETLHRIHADPQLMRTYQPWNVLLLMKWALQEHDETAHRRAPVTKNDFHIVLRMIQEIDAKGLLPSHAEHITLFLRRIAFQQFWLQDKFSGPAVARQHLLFSALPPEHPLPREFQKTTGVSISDFATLAFSTFALVLQQPCPIFISVESYRLVEPRFPPGTIARFLRHMSRTTAEMCQWLRGDEFKTPIEHQVLLRSPLIEFPLLTRDKERDYIILYPTLFIRALETAVYRTLRRLDANAFGYRFGPVFETHLARCLDSGGVSYLNEQALRSRLQGEGKCVDFLIEEEDCVVLLDAKGVEMSVAGQLTHRADHLFDRIKESAIKGLEQGLATHQRLGITKECFVLVVTYEQLFVGTNALFSAMFKSRIVPRMEEKFGKTLPVPLANIFLLTVDEFERTVAHVAQKNDSFGGILRFVREEDRAHHTTRMTFQQHLNERGEPVDHLPLISRALDELTTRCMGDEWMNVESPQ